MIIILKDRAIAVNKGKLKFMHKKSDFESISNFISNIDWLQRFENKNVQEMYDELIFCTEEACNLYTAIKNISNSMRNKSPWISKSLKSLIRDIKI
jgi:hypothetical protein